MVRSSRSRQGMVRRKPAHVHVRRFDGLGPTREGNLGGGQFMEFQLVDDALSKDPKFQTGAIFGVIAPDPRPKATLEQWHRVAIRLDKRHLRVVFDDQQIMFTNLDDHKERFGPFLGLTKTTGRIGLQLYPGRIEFREIRVRELK